MTAADDPAEIAAPAGSSSSSSIATSTRRSSASRAMPDADELTVKRLKKRKLRIKDCIAQLEVALIPDEPA